MEQNAQQAWQEELVDYARMVLEASVKQDVHPDSAEKAHRLREVSPNLDCILSYMEEFSNGVKTPSG